ncbi:MAG: hypothetical protein ACJAXZ_001000, partial [Akkermansiaceae bacterium]
LIVNVEQKMPVLGLGYVQKEGIWVKKES